MVGPAGKFCLNHTGTPAARASRLERVPPVRYNPGFDSTNYYDRNAMEAERINALSALLNDLTDREAELRRYL
jgi:hypothetical protein